MSKAYKPARPAPCSTQEIKNDLAAEWSAKSATMRWLEMEWCLQAILCNPEFTDKQKVAWTKECVDAYTKRGHFSEEQYGSYNDTTSPTPKQCQELLADCFRISEQGRGFEVWVNEDHEYMIIEYQPHEEGDAESGPSTGWHPELVESGIGVARTTDGALDCVRHFIATEKD